MGKCGNRELWKWRTGELGQWGTEVLGNSGDDEMRQCGKGEMGKCGTVQIGAWGNGEVGKWEEGQTSKWNIGKWGTMEREKDGGKVEWRNKAIGSWHSPFGTDRKQHRNRHARMHIHKKVAFPILWLVGTAA